MLVYLEVRSDIVNSVHAYPLIKPCSGHSELLFQSLFLSDIYVDFRVFCLFYRSELNLCLL